MLHLGGNATHGMIHEMSWLMHVGMKMGDWLCWDWFYFLWKVKQSWGFGVPMSVSSWYVDAFEVPMTIGFWFMRVSTKYLALIHEGDFFCGCQWKIWFWLFWLPMKDWALVSERLWLPEIMNLTMLRPEGIYGCSWCPKSNMLLESCIFVHGRTLSSVLNRSWRPVNDFMTSCISHIIGDSRSPFRHFKIKTIYYYFQMLLLLPKFLMQSL